MATKYRDMAHREPLAWLPDDRYVYDIPFTTKEKVRIVLGSITVLVVAVVILLAIALVPVK